jgi:hypothetical protein
MKNKSVKEKDFIAIYDNYILPEECDKAIKLFEERDKFKKTFTRLDFENTTSTVKKDKYFFANSTNMDVWFDDLKPMMLNFDMAWKNYYVNHGLEKVYSPLEYTTLKIQKTLPKEGYHVWHVEQNGTFYECKRAFVFSIYLNDVKEGGETEFLNHSVRVKPKKGRIVIWPAGFPYLHRGNPPLSGKKYILTSWIMIQ